MSPPVCEGGFNLPVGRGGKDQKKFLGGGKWGRDFLPIFSRGGVWNVYDSKIEICKINYCENKVKYIKKISKITNNKDNSKNNVNEIKEII